jgi:hypothetical protein
LVDPIQYKGRFGLTAGASVACGCVPSCWSLYPKEEYSGNQITIVLS